MAEVASQCRADAARAVDFPSARRGCGSRSCRRPCICTRSTSASRCDNTTRKGWRRFALGLIRGATPALAPEDESVVVEIATLPPRGFGQPFHQWSLRKLTDHLVGRQMIPKVSHVTIGKVLDRHGVTYQRTRYLEGVDGSGLRPEMNESTDSTGGRRRTRS